MFVQYVFTTVYIFKEKNAVSAEYDFFRGRRLEKN